MQQLFDFLEKNFWLLFIFALIWNVIFMGLFVWRRYTNGSSSSQIAETDVVFIQRYASGFSHKNLLTRLGGAKNALVVTVSKEALLIEPIDLIKWIMPIKFNDLEHYILKSNIVGTQQSSVMGKNSIQVEFRTNNGEKRVVELFLNKPQEFLSALDIK